MRKLILLVILSMLTIISLGQTVIQMVEDMGVYKVPCEINGLKMKMVFDTGAASVSISHSMAEMMLENGYLEKSDLGGQAKSMTADGSIVDHTNIVLRTVKIGELTLKNVNAVVINRQTTPLLFGQSAIQRLGKIMINGNKLIITSHNSQAMDSGKIYTEEELLQIHKDAAELYANRNYIAAVDMYDLLEVNRCLPPYEVSMYASCLSGVGRHEESLQKYLSIVDWTIENEPEELGCLYLRLSEESYFCNEFYNSIRYGGECQVKSGLLSEERCAVTRRICWSYIELGDAESAMNIAKSYLSNYFSYLKISSTDCWTKGYRDRYVAVVYYTIACFYKTYAEGKKYFLISAAWGDKDAIEVCNKFKWNYEEKPYEFVY